MEYEEHQIESLSKSLPLGVVVQASDGRITACNTIAEQLLGLSKPQLLGRESVDPRWRAVHEDGSPFPGEEHPAMVSLATGEPQRDVVMGIHKPLGELSWILVNTIPLLQEDTNESLMVVSTFVDHNKTKRVADLLGEAALHREFLFRYVDGIVCYFDHRGTIVDVSPSVLDVLDHSPTSLKGKSLYSFIHPEDEKQLVSKGFDSMVEKGSEPMELRFRKSDGSYKWLAFQPVFLGHRREASPSKARYISFLRDISIQKRESIELHMAKERAEQASEAKSKFISNVSHELRTPLNGILGMLDLIQDMEDIEQRQSFVDMARVSARNMLKLVEDLLAFSRLGTSSSKKQLRYTDVFRLLEQLVAPHRTIASAKGIEILLQKGEGNCHMGVDTHKLSQVVTNLLSNSVKFSDSGVITVECGLVNDTVPHLEINVRDQGIGIDSNHLSEIFEPFSQLEDPYTKMHPGLGLGLAICKGLVDQMGGVLSVRSTKGQGSVFSLRVPVIPDQRRAGLDRDRGVDEENSCSDMSPDQCKILLVEDDEVNMLLGRRILEREGYTVLAANDGHQAMEIASAEKPHCILMDLGLPRMNGMRAIREIRLHSDLEKTPIIVITAHAHEEIQDHLLVTGAQAILNKPYSQEELIGAVRRALCS